MEEGAVLIILKAFINLMLPEYATGAGDVNEGKEMGTSRAVCYEYEGTL
jgi:hypothetical protein